MRYAYDITVHQGSILNATTEAIVNPANSFLRHGGGLAAVIAAAAAPIEYTDGLLARGEHPAYVDRLRRANERSRAWREEQERAPNIPTGDAYPTSAGALPFRHIIHAVGPIWGGGYYYERELLISAYQRAIQVMRATGNESVAMPAISAGVFGVPIEVVAYCAEEATYRSKLEPHERVEFWLFSREHYDAFAAKYPGAEA